MEYVEGVDLERLVESEGPLDCDYAADYIRQAADGLAHAHQRNMIHCDVKPSNLLVNRQGVIKILDLGLARFTGDEEGKAGGHDQQALGSVDYLAPEQAMHSPALDHRADIYSPGLHALFPAERSSAVCRRQLASRLLRHQTEEPPDIREEQPRVPAELAAICRKMMAKKAEDRYSSAAEVSRVLADWERTAPVVRRPGAPPMDQLLDELATEPVSLPPAVARTAGTPWLKYGIIAIVVMGLVELVAYLMIFSGGTQRPPRRRPRLPGRCRLLPTHRRIRAAAVAPRTTRRAPSSGEPRDVAKAGPPRSMVSSRPQPEAEPAAKPGPPPETQTGTEPEVEQAVEPAPNFRTLGAGHGGRLAVAAESRRGAAGRGGRLRPWQATSAGGRDAGNNPDRRQENHSRPARFLRSGARSSAAGRIG